MGGAGDLAGAFPSAGSIGSGIKAGPAVDAGMSQLVIENDERSRLMMSEEREEAQASHSSQQPLLQPDLADEPPFGHSADEVLLELELLMSKLDQRLQSASDLLGKSVSALGIATARLQALASEFFEHQILEGDSSRDDFQE